MKFVILGSFASVLLSSALAYADALPVPPQASPEIEDAQMNHWYCFDKPDDLGRLRFNSSGVQVNNFAVVQAKETLTDAPVLTISASLVNRSKRWIGASLEFAGFQGSAVALAVSAAPILPVSPDHNVVIDGSVYAPFGTLASFDRVCLRVVGYRSADNAPTQ